MAEPDGLKRTNYVDMPQTTVPGNIFAKEMRIVDRFIDQGAVFVAKVEYMAGELKRELNEIGKIHLFNMLVRKVAWRNRLIMFFTSPTVVFSKTRGAASSD